MSGRPSPNIIPLVITQGESQDNLLATGSNRQRQALFSALDGLQYRDLLAVVVANLEGKVFPSNNIEELNTFPS